jgi:hypothetical protein
LIVLNRLAVSEGNACEQQLDLFGAADAAPRFSRICARAWFDDGRSRTQGNAAPGFLGFLDQLECQPSKRSTGLKSSRRFCRTGFRSTKATGGACHWLN